MMKFTKKKLIVGGIAVAVVAAGAGTALAYWTTSGSGTGSATNASSNGTIVLHASFANGLTPGASESCQLHRRQRRHVEPVRRHDDLDRLDRRRPLDRGCLVGDFTSLRPPRTPPSPRTGPASLRAPAP